MSQAVRKPLSRVVLVGVGLRIALVAVIAALVAYYSAASVLESNAIDLLSLYVDESSARENQKLVLVQQNLEVMRQHYLSLRASTDEQELAKRFDTLVRQRPDGALQSDLNTPPSLWRCTIFVPKDAHLTTEIKARMTILYDLCGIFGPAWREQFPGGLYFETYQSANIEYHGVLPAWSSNAPATWNLTGRKEFVVSTPENNPSRRVAWTAPFYSDYMKAMMVDAVIPLDENGEHVATGGLNILVDRLLQRTRAESLAGGYNLLIRSDGLLVAGPKSLPQANVKNMKDQKLSEIFEYVSSLPSSTRATVGRLKDDYIGVAKLPGPDYYFIAVLPRSSVLEPARSLAWVGVLSGAVFIFLEIAMLWQFLRKKVTQPLKELTFAAEQIQRNEMNVNFSQQATHELQRLTEAFVAMARGVADRDAKLEAHARQLEETVKQRTDELQSAHYTQLVQATKLNSLGLLVAGVAHEINNPNHSIQGNATLLARVWKDTQPILQQHYEKNGDFDLGGIPYSELNRDASELFVAIASCSRRIQTFIEELKRFARKDSTPFEQIDLRRVLESSVLLIKSSLKKKCLLRVNSADELTPILGHFTQLEQAVVNLLQNAAESFPDSRPLDQRHIVVSISANNGGVELLVADNGAGINAEDQQHLMEPFFTTKGARGGTGLGLYVTASIVKAHGGTMSFESSLDLGTKVRVWFPAGSKTCESNREPLDMKAS